MNKTTLTLIFVTLIGVLLGILITVKFLPHLFVQSNPQSPNSLSISAVTNSNIDQVRNDSNNQTLTNLSQDNTIKEEAETVGTFSSNDRDTFQDRGSQDNSFAKVNNSQNSREQLLSTPIDDLQEQDIAEYLRAIAHQAYFQQLATIRDLLTRFPYNADLLLAEGDILEQLGEYDDALDNYQLIIEHSDSTEVIERATLRFVSLLKQYGRDLNNADDAAALFDLYQRYKDTLMVINQWTSFHVFYAKHLVDSGDTTSFDYFYEQWRHTPKAKQNLDIIKSQNEEATFTSKAIPLTKSGNHFIVDVHINGVLFQLLIDTGASMTVLTKEALHRLRGSRVRRQSVMQFNTAGGMVEAPVFQSSTIGIGPFVLADEKFAVMNFRTRYDGLLGMNYLSQFEFNIDQEGGLLFLSLAN